MWARRFAGSLLRSHSVGVLSPLAGMPTAARVAAKSNSIVQLPSIQTQQTRSLGNLQPRRRKYKKAQKGRVPVRVGGSTKGNYILSGDYGLRVKEGLRLSAKTIEAIHAMLRRQLKAIKELQIWLRVFPDIPVSTKGNEVRMGKGKGAFDYWACRVPKDKIIFELKGPGLNKELAKDALRQAGFKLGVRTEIVIADETNRQPKKCDLPPTTVPFQQAK
ncbi:39S ribosomal protein L16, mitochondrial [Coemansia sp. RSA 1365]|nr:39S ribosomal protein L16, mitochondrial [Coemansia sp. RSA 1365]